MAKTCKDIATFLKLTDMTQGELAQQLGISQAFLSQIINGQRSPSLRLAAAIEDATGVTMRSMAREAAAS